MSKLKISIIALEPSLWETLPTELLHLVFARLPVAGIGRLRVLSKEWKKNIDCKDSEFNHILDATTHFNMFALLPLRYALSFGIVYDVQADKRHIYKYNVQRRKVETLVGAHGGLVCCVLEWRWCYNKPRMFIVMNLLTKQKTQLPPLLNMVGEKSSIAKIVIRIVKLIVDRKTKEYRVFVVGSIVNNGQGFFAQVYDSHIKEWMVVDATYGHIIGWDCLHSIEWNIAFCSSFCVYNCVDGTLQLIKTNIASGFKIKPGCCMLIEDHLFVLHKKTFRGPSNILEDGKNMLSQYCISEFHLPKKTNTWVKLGEHTCGLSKWLSDSQHGITNLRLWGCDEFLLVHGDGSEHSWLYNLSTCEWRTLRAFEKTLFPAMMSTINWCAMA